MNEEVINKVASLWSKYVDAKRALRESGFIRSYRQAEADLSEWLVKHFIEGELPSSRSQGSFDVITNDGKRIQVKSIAKDPDNPNGYIISNKDRDPKSTVTHYAFVCFNDLIPEAIFLTPGDYVRNFQKSQIKPADLEKTKYRLDIDLTPFKKKIINA